MACAATGVFGDLCWALGWGLGDSITVLFGYYDESGELAKDGQLINMSIGACISTCEKWKALDKAWRGALAEEGLLFFHMADFEAWASPFDFKLSDGTRDYAKHRRLLNRLLALMVEHIEWFAGFSPGDEITSDRSEAHGEALRDCVMGAVSHAHREVWEKRGEPLRMIFAKQEHFSWAKIAAYIENYERRGGEGHIRGPAFELARDLPPLQAADILAYEVAREQRDKAPNRYPMRYLKGACRERGLTFTLSFGCFDSTAKPSVRGPAAPPRP